MNESDKLIEDMSDRGEICGLRIKFFYTVLIERLTFPHRAFVDGDGLSKARMQTCGNLRKRGPRKLSRTVFETNNRVDARSWPGSRRLAAARKLASSSQSVWLGASSLPHSKHPSEHNAAHLSPTLRERISSGESRHRGKRCQIFGSLRRLKTARSAFLPFFFMRLTKVEIF